VKRTVSAADEEARQTMRWLARHDLYYLFDLLNQERQPDGTYQPRPGHQPGELQRRLCQFVQTTPYRQNLYLVSRGFLKTTILTVCKNIQLILNDPQTRILIASNKSENAEGMLAELKAGLVHPLLLWCFPDILYADPERQAEMWTRGAITVRRTRKTKEATVETIGISGEITSRHYTHGSFDDLVGRENYATRELREDVKQFVRSASFLFDPGATLDTTGTTWHYDDHHAVLRSRAKRHGGIGLFEEACWYPDPAGAEVPGYPEYGRVRVTYPEKWSPALLVEHFLREAGPSAFAAQCLLDPLPPGSVYFPRTKIQVMSRHEMPPLDTMWKVMTVDPAISEKGYADFSAIAVVGFDQTNVMWILDLRRARWPESELVAQVYDAFARTPGIVTIGFEAIGFAKIYMRLFTSEGDDRGYYLPVHKLERDTKAAKNTRIRALEPPWAKGMVRILNDVPVLEEFLDEAEKWRPDRENTHDDMLDAVVDSLQMRLKPAGEEPPRPDDPEVEARLLFEANVRRQRARRRAPPLDRTELRAAYHMQRVRESREMDYAQGVDEW